MKSRVTGVGGGADRKREVFTPQMTTGTGAGPG